MKNHHYQRNSGFAWKTFHMCKNLFTLAYEAKFAEKHLTITFQGQYLLKSKSIKLQKYLSNKILIR